MQPGIVLSKDDAPETPDPKEQKVYQSFVAETQFVANWVKYDVPGSGMYLLQHHNWLFSVHLQTYCIGLHCICDGISAQQSKFQTRISEWKL